MSDEQQATYPGTAEPGQASPLQGAPPKYVTEEGLLAFKEEVLRAVQSMTDKQQSRVDKRLSDWETKRNAEGRKVTPQEKEAARVAFEVQELESDGGQPAQAVAPALDPNVAKVNARIVQLNAEAGAEIGPDDPEYDEINWSVNPKDPQGTRFLSTYEKKLKEKKARLAAQTLPANPARVPGPTGAASGDLMAEYKQEIAKVPPGSEASFQIRRKFREKGLQI